MKKYNEKWIGICASKLKAERLMRDMTQEKFAEELGINDSTYKKTERRVLLPSVELLKSAKKYTGRTIDYFVSEEDGDVEKAWSLVDECTDVDKVIILIRLLAALGKEKCYEIIDNCKEDI